MTRGCAWVCVKSPKDGWYSKILAQGSHVEANGVGGTENVPGETAGAVYSS